MRTVNVNKHWPWISPVSHLFFNCSIFCYIIFTSLWNCVLLMVYCRLYEAKVEEDGDQKTSVSSASHTTRLQVQQLRTEHRRKHLLFCWKYHKPIHLIYTGIILNRMILEYDHLKEEWNTEKLYFSFKKRIVKKRMILRFRQQKMKKLMTVNWSINVLSSGKEISRGK